MNVEWFIARRLLLKGNNGKSVVLPIVRIAVVGIALGVCVMLLSLFVIVGFKQEITGKLSGFVSHLNIVPYASYDSSEGTCVRDAASLVAEFQGMEGVTNVYGYIEKPSILKSETEIHGVVMKGVDSTCNTSFFQQHLQEGRMPDFGGDKTSNDILISRTVATMLGVSVGDNILAYFVQEPPRVRKLNVVGIYNTGFKEYDDVMALIDIRHLARLNGWQPGEVSGVAMNVKDMRDVEMYQDAVYDVLDAKGMSYLVKTFKDEAPQIFDWLALLNMNVWVILILIITVAGVNMVSGLLILILDKTPLIGMLKALGCRNVSLRRLFLYIAGRLMFKGLLWGNVLAFLLAGIQVCFQVIRLDPATYYMDAVPLDFNLWYVFLLDVGVMALIVLILIVPTMLISRISPVKAIHFE